MAYSVINAFNIVEELTTPNSNLAGRILIECSKGELNVVKDLSSKAEAAGQKLFLQPMLITALVFNHIEVAKFCIEKGASTDGDVEVAAWSTRSKESFELLFPLDIFSWSRHREYLDNLLYDCFDRLPKTSNTDNGVTESEVRSLAEFLFEHGAKVQSYTAKLSSFRWPTLMPFLLSHISQEECKEGVLIHAIDESIKYHSENEDLIKLLLSHSADANIPANVMWLAVSRRLEIVKLLLAHGIPLTEPRLLHEAALSGKADIISFLLDNGLSVNRRDTKGYFGVYSYQDPPFPNYGYALHYAVYMAQPEAVRVLLERGADPILRGVAGATVFEMPVGWSYHPEERKNEVKRLLGLVRDEPVEDIPKIIQRDRAERAGAHVEL